MSATGRGSVRKKDDAYTTPPWCVDRLLEAWRPTSRSGILVEPAVGDGAIVLAVGTEHFIWLTYDIRDVAPVGEKHVTGDFLKVGARGTDADAVITNPPYSLAEEFLRHSRSCFPRADIVFLLRLGFLASEDRRRLWDVVGQPDVFVLPNRPDFTGGGGDSSDYAWFAWPQTPRPSGSLRILATTPKEVRAAQKPKRAAKASNEGEQ